MSEQNNNSPASNANPNNPTHSQSSSSAKPVLEKLKDWLDIIAKLSPLLIAIGGTIGGVLLANHIQDKLSAANLLSQREQAETQLRATMFNNLMERIVTKDQQKELESEKMLLLAELLALNFDEHFQFKPLLIYLQKKIKGQQNQQLKDKQSELESVARRIVDRQTDMLRAVVRTQGDEYQQDDGKIQDIFTSDLFFKIKKFEKSNLKSKLFRNKFNDIKKSNDDIPTSYECNYIDTTSFGILDISALGNLQTLSTKLTNEAWLNTQQRPAYFTNKGPLPNEGFSQCIAVVSSDAKKSPESAYLLEIAVLKYDPEEKTVTVSVNVTGGTLRSVSMVYEFDVTPFDFPLTDNTAIDSDHRFAIVQRSIINDEIWLRLIWFPKGYITERERPINYSDMRELLKAKKESNEKWYGNWWSNLKNWWSNLKNWWSDLPEPQIIDTTL